MWKAGDHRERATNPCVSDEPELHSGAYNCLKHERYVVC